MRKMKNEPEVCSFCGKSLSLDEISSQIEVTETEGGEENWQAWCYDCYMREFAEEIKSGEMPGIFDASAGPK
jgi:hypothetical protein